MTCLVAVLAMPYALSPLTPMSMLERPAGHAGFLVLEPVALSVPLGSILERPAGHAGFLVLEPVALSVPLGSMLERPAGHAGFLVLEPVALSVPLGSILGFRGGGGRNLCQEIDAGFIVATVVVVVVVVVVPMPLLLAITIRIILGTPDANQPSHERLCCNLASRNAARAVCNVWESLQRGGSQSVTAMLNTRDHTAV